MTLDGRWFLTSSGGSAHEPKMRLFARPDKGGVYYVEFGRGQKRSLKTTDRREAERRFKILQRELATGRLLALDRRSETTLGAFRERFVDWALGGGQNPRTARLGRLALDHLVAVAGESVRLDRIGVAHADLLKRELRRRECAQATIDTYLRHIKAALSKAVDWELVAVNPLAKVKIKRRKPQVRPYLPPGSFEAFLGSIDDPLWRRVLALYCATGRRRSELLAVQGRDIDIERGIYRIGASKSDESKGWYPMTTAAKAIFKTFLPLAPDQHLLPRWHPDTISHRAKEWLVKAGFPDVSLHGLRASFGIEYLNKGGNLLALQDLLGHADFKTTEDYYGELVPGYLDREASRIDFSLSSLRRVK